MKYIITFLLFVPFAVNSQEGKINFIHELFMSINRTDVHDSNTEDRFGFGVGVAHLWRKEKHFNIGLGIEFNQTYQYKKILFSYPNERVFDLNYQVSILAIPLFIRYGISINSHSIFFCEAGIYRDFVFSSKMRGRKSTRIPDENGTLVYNEFDINQSGALYSNNGFSVALGFKFPSKTRLISIKTEYKYGPKSLDEFFPFFNTYFRICFGVSMYKI